MTNIQHKGIVGIGVIVIIVIAVVAYLFVFSQDEVEQTQGTSQDNEQNEQVKVKGKLTITEYARACANQFNSSSNNDLQAGTTYKEVKEHFKNNLKVIDNIEPPEELRTYHNLQKKGIEYFEDIVNDKKDDDIFATSDLLEGDIFIWALAYGNDVAEVLQALTPTTQNILLEAGCIDEDDIEKFEGFGT